MSQFVLEFPNHTRLIIAHRLETIQSCDLIIVMKDGCVAECGTPNSLMQQNKSLFKEMMQAAMHKETNQSVALLGSHDKRLSVSIVWVNIITTTVLFIVLRYVCMAVSQETVWSGQRQTTFICLMPCISVADSIWVNAKPLDCLFIHCL